MKKQDQKHQLRCIAGSYECVDCDFSTLNVWVAKHHYAKNNGIDLDIMDIAEIS